MPWIMNRSEKQFNSIVSKFSSLDQDVMMSSPGLKFKDKVFAFYHKETMGFRLGPNFNPVKVGLENAKPLSPFKKKRLLKDGLSLSNTKVKPGICWQKCRWNIPKR